MEFRGLVVGAAVVAFIAALMAASPARAQLTLQVPPEPTGPLIREAFTSAYGQALADGLGEALRNAADPACLDSKKVKATELRQRGLDLMTKWGTKMLDASLSLIDSKIYEAKLADADGPNASAELTRLTDDADVKRYREIERPIRLTGALDTVFEQFDRYTEATGIKLAPVSPLAGGNDTLLSKDPTEESEKGLKDFMAGHQSPALKRFLKLSEDAADAMTGAVNAEKAGKMGPTTFFRGIETDLAEICVH